MKKIIRIILRIAGILVSVPAVIMLLIFLNFHLIGLSVRHKIYEIPGEVPFRKTTLVMGGGNYKPEQWTNHTFNHRMLSTAMLYKEHKTERIIASGVRISEEYNEVSEMRQVLMDYGIPATAIISDYGGNRTWTSVERAYKFYYTDSIIIVSQCDQLERALFIAKCIGLNAIGFKAAPIPRKHRMWTIREYLARVKCTFDCIKYQFSF